MQPLVSILIPAFNAEAWIAETIQSALDQTWPKTEIIVVNDGSTDGTLEAARRFESKSVSVISQENQGACVARNTAFARCQGDYIQWLDADDLLARDKIERQVRLACEVASKETLFTAPWRYFYFEPIEGKAEPTSIWRDLTPVEFMIKGMEENLFMTNACWLASRELTKAAGPWDTDLRVDQDGEYFCRVVAASKAVRFVPDAWMYYRRSGRQSTSNIGRSPEKLKSMVRSLRLQIVHLRAIEDSERVRKAGIKILQRNLIHFIPEHPELVRELEQLAESLGGKLEEPRMSWKYDWLRVVFGFGCAKRARDSYNRIKTSAIRARHRTAFLFRGSEARGA